MSRSAWDARELIDVAIRHEALPSRDRLAKVRSAVLRRAVAGAAAAVVGPLGFWAKAAALGATTTGNVVLFVTIGAMAGGAMMSVAGVARKPVGVHHEAPSRVVSNTVVPPLSSISAGSIPAAVPETPVPPVEERAATALPAASDVLRTVVVPPPVQPSVAAASQPTTSLPAVTAAPVEPSTKPAGDLARQLDLLRRMRSALGDRRPLDALSMFQSAERMFRGSPFEPEARVVYVAALCQLGRADDAKRETARFEAEFPSSHLARRLASGCPNEP